MRRSSSACGGSVWRRICANHGDRGPLVESISSATYAGEKRRGPGAKYHSPIAATCASSASGSNVSGSGR